MTKSEAKQCITLLKRMQGVLIPSSVIEDFLNRLDRGITFNDDIEKREEVSCLYCGSKALIHYDSDKHYECLECKNSFII